LADANIRLRGWASNADGNTERLWRHDFLERVEIEAVEVISDFE